MCYCWLVVGLLLGWLAVGTWLVGCWLVAGWLLVGCWLVVGWGCYERDGQFLSQHHTHACMCAMRQTVCACAQVKCTQRTRTFPMSQVGSRSIWCACALVQAHTLMKPSFFQLACVAHSPACIFSVLFSVCRKLTSFWV